MRSGRAPRQMSLNADQKLLDFYFKLHARRGKRGGRRVTTKAQQERLDLGTNQHSPESHPRYSTFETRAPRP